MRCLLAGMLFLCCFPVVALAQMRGEVESIGFGSLYRPNTHVPMLIRVSADKSGTYQLRVVQEDLDRDHEVFTQTVSLTGSEDGRGGEQRFWTYFVPQPTEGGLPDTTRGGTLRDLQQQLKVFLYDESGTKQLAQLPITQTIQNVENFQAGPFTAPRGTKLILAVGDGPNQPVWRDYQQAIGTMEDVVFVPVRSGDLPEDVRGFEMVDAVVWLSAPVPDPSKPSDEKRFRALQAYVRGGGHLVVCQPAQRDATAPLADMLPVVVNEVAPKATLEPLRTLATERQQEIFEALRAEEQKNDPFAVRQRRDDWALPQGPYMFARATLKPGAAVAMSIDWTGNPADASPYIARLGYGLGCVSWVAHDLSDPVITGRAKSGWPYVWDRVLDFKHDLVVVDNQTSETMKRPYAPGSAVDVGFALLRGMELSSKSRALVSIAVVFFIAYWLIAGPGVYLYLLTKSRPQLSWFLFAGAAVAATLFTVLVVRLVVRGSPELAHVTVVRGSSGEPQQAISQFGLYIPRDGAQEITLPEVAPKHVSYLAAYPQHPQHTPGDVAFPAKLPYVVPIRDSSEDGPITIEVPYRSTLKKFFVRRVGAAGGEIAGSAKLREEEGRWLIEGRITNGTGQRLRNVYLAYYDPTELRQDDMILYLPVWEPSQTIDLSEYNGNAPKTISTRADAQGSPFYAQPEMKVRIKGWMGKPGRDEGWSRFWYASLRNGGFGNVTLDDLTKDVKNSFPIMSLFNRLPPMRNPQNGGTDRVELLRRGGRHLDLSSAIAAGRMVILAEADGQPPLPFPLRVEGEEVSGKGYTFFQSVLPMERIPLPATTQPAGDPPPAAQPAAATQPVARAAAGARSTEASHAPAPPVAVTTPEAATWPQ